MKFNKLSLKWKLFFAILFFAVLIICVVVIFQISLLEPFYKNRKINRSLELTNKISKIIDNQEIINFENNDSEVIAEIQKISAKEEVAVYLFVNPNQEKSENLMDDDNFKGSLLYKSYPGGYFNKLDYDSILEMWNKSTTEELDIFYAVLGISPNPNFPKIEIYDAQMPKQQLLKKFSYQKVSLMCCTFINLNDNSKCMLILDNNLIPLDSAVEILKLQLTYITLIVFVLSIIIAIFLSKYISKPIAKLNSSAKKMASGNYNVIFEGKGYLEINQLNENLNNTVKELQKTDTLRRELMANVSHDLRTPLTMIRGYAEMMKDIPEENNVNNLQIIIDEVDRLNNIVSDMLDLSRLSSKTLELCKEEYSITESLKSIINRIISLNDNMNVTIKLNADKEVFVYADEAKIEQVIYNFIYNAINYGKDNIMIEVNQEIFGDKVKISVKDNGLGISEDDLKVIWNRYYRVDKSHQLNKNGTGLGLSIVKEILTYHGFEYGVSSEIEKGSIFWFIMPIKK